MESELTMFRTFTADAASKSCGLRVVGACYGGNHPMVDGRVEGSRQVEVGGLLGLIVPGVTRSS